MLDGSLSISGLGQRYEIVAEAAHETNVRENLSTSYQRSVIKVTMRSADRSTETAEHQTKKSVHVTTGSTTNPPVDQTNTN